ncbi:MULTISPECIES: metal-dependent hydrolase [Acidianus]|uniref:UPF0173 metal-dependent hydrolase CM19_10165 n=1 Tax=Candidatus Acidianus copahuensis TaxID=1160895 RepID=A0A031LM09_9CREN|nr:MULTISPECIES: metal-dependent hydrolase [Acidianus]EZQ03181.1 hydrolase [Candidatus Acidianus copahuensis]NON61959.1 metal-dependent hydrolase [Acidianus sp. RZ1]
MPELRWIGHAAVELDLKDKKIIIDPFITDNPKSAVRLEYFDSFDIIVVTHDHYDHLGNTVDIVKRNSKVKILATYDLEVYLNKEFKIPFERMIPANVGGYINEGEIRFALTQAIHSSEHSDPTGVIVSDGSVTIYHAGDTGLFEGMKLIGEVFSPDYALLPIGGRFTMDPHQAAIAVSMIKPKKASIPIHYNTWDAIKVDPSDFEKEVKERGYRSIILNPGDKLEL